MTVACILRALEPGIGLMLQQAEGGAAGQERLGMAHRLLGAPGLQIDVQIAQIFVHARQGERYRRR